MQQVEP